MSDAVTSLFEWGLKQLPSNINIVDIVVLSGFRPSQLVSYAKGQLRYVPEVRSLPPKITATPAKFESAPEGITQQFSDRTIELPGPTPNSFGTSQNFAATKEDTLTMTLTEGPESLIIASTEFKFTVTVPLSADAATGVMTGNTEGWFYVVMFGAPASTPPIQ